jgi:ribose transport system ATP-binding protein
MVEIAKALSINARILIMDEPTSSLSQRETEQLYRVIRELRARGVSIVYISHRLGEVKALADRVVVLRDGKNAGELQRDEIDHDAMVRLMVGRTVSTQSRTGSSIGDAVLAVNELRTNLYPQHAVSFELRQGEIAGMAGLVGAGRTEILETIFGVRPKHGGLIAVNGKSLHANSPKAAIRAGIALVPEDRKQQGLVLEMMVRENLSLASVRRDSHRGLLNRREERNLCAEMMQRLDIRTPSDRQPVQLLSGGNQQKVVLGKWLALRPRILLLDEPTRGIDVGAKREIYTLMEQLAAGGVAILFVSSEMEEILTMSDRVLVIHEGQLTGQLTGPNLTEENVMQHATGNIPAIAQ